MYDEYDGEWALEDELNYMFGQDPDEIEAYYRVFDREAYDERRADEIYEDYKLGLCDKNGNYHQHSHYLDVA